MTNISSRKKRQVWILGYSLWWNCQNVPPRKITKTTGADRIDEDPDHNNNLHKKRAYTVPKVIDCPWYNMKCSGENEILRGIYHVHCTVVSRFPLHFVLYRENLDYCFDIVHCWCTVKNFKITLIYIFWKGTRYFKKIPTIQVLRHQGFFSAYRCLGFNTFWIWAPVALETKRQRFCGNIRRIWRWDEKKYTKNATLGQQIRRLSAATRKRLTILPLSSVLAVRVPAWFLCKSG